MSFLPGIDPAPGDARASDVIDTKIVSCVSCGNLIDESLDASLAVRTPCPSCGSLSRRFEANVVESIAIREKWGMKLKALGTGKPVFESVSGSDYHRNTGQWNQIERVIDRGNDWYEEKIVNPETGDVIHHCAEKLSNHTGHGSAKANLNRDTKDK
jgi:predicted RNA-binding Zn-ribbon protein involved in translation (DUF1610 family)